MKTETLLSHNPQTLCDMRNWAKLQKNVYLDPSPVCHRQVRVHVHIFQKGPQTLQKTVSGSLLATRARLEKMCTSIPHLSVTDR